MTSLLILLTIIVAGMNLVNYNTIVAESDEILSLLLQNKGTFPDIKPEKREMFPRYMSPETPYESRYFSILMNADGSIIHTETSKIAAIDIETAIKFANIAERSGKTSGFVGEYRFVRHTESDRSLIIFLDCGRKLTSFNTFLKISVGMSLAGFLIVFFVITICSGRIIRPIAESYEKQKQFITDAGHEIKTPLTIINANIDILEMELGENDSLEDIKQQTSRLKSLTNDLVTLARTEESEENLQKIEFPISEVVAETAHSFQAPAVQQGKEFVCNIQPMLSLKGNDKAIHQLVTILMDNALKYSPSGGKIVLSMVKQNKAICISVFNTTEAEVKQENLDRVFDRFYRMDTSRNSETGGHGIGLSLAKAIVAAHDGKIQASAQDSHSFRITAVLPI